MRHDEAVARDERSRDRHRHPTIGLRLPEELAERLEAYVKAAGGKKHAFIVEAVREKLDRVAGNPKEN